jgi:hypothetical protein
MGLRCFLFCAVKGVYSPTGKARIREFSSTLATLQANSDIEGSIPGHDEQMMIFIHAFL